MKRKKTIQKPPNQHGQHSSGIEETVCRRATRTKQTISIDKLGQDSKDIEKRHGKDEKEK